MLLLEESWLQAMCQLEQIQRLTKAFFDRHPNNKEKLDKGGFSVAFSGIKQTLCV